MTVVEFIVGGNLIVLGLLMFSALAWGVVLGFDWLFDKLT